MHAVDEVTRVAVCDPVAKAARRRQSIACGSRGDCQQVVTGAGKSRAGSQRLAVGEDATRGGQLVGGTDESDGLLGLQAERLAIAIHRETRGDVHQRIIVVRLPGEMETSNP